MPGEVNTVDPPEPQEELENLDSLEASDLISAVLETVPEHQGGISALIERYGDDPTKCPFLNSMGAKGMELYQRAKEHEAIPDRGPTMRELLEAKRQKSEQPAQPQVKKVDTTDETREVLEASKPPASEVNETPLVAEVSKPTAIEEDELLQEREILLRSILENEPLPAPLTEVLEPKHSQAKVELDDIIIDEGRAEEGTEEVLPASSTFDAVIEAEQGKGIAAVRNESIVVAETPSLPILEIKPDVSPTASLLVENEPVAITPLPAVASSTEEQKPVKAETAVDAIIHSVDSESIFTALAEAMPDLPVERDEALMPSLIEEASLEIGIIQPLHDLEAPSGTTTFYALEEAGVEEDVHYFESDETETLTPVSLQEKILSFVEQLDDDETEEPQGYLNELIEIMNLVSASSELEPETEEQLVADIEKVLIKLFESIKLDLDEKIIASMARSLVTNRPTLPKQKSRYSIDQLNILGTREYKSNSFKSSLVNLLQALKDKISARLNIGKLALNSTLSL